MFYLRYLFAYSGVFVFVLYGSYNVGVTFPCLNSLRQQLNSVQKIPVLGTSSRITNTTISK
jgi:hypothetical protein